MDRIQCSSCGAESYNDSHTVLYCATCYQRLQVEVEQLRGLAADAQLTLATLCDIVLSEDADDRSDDALVRAVGMLKRKVERLNMALLKG